MAIPSVIKYEGPSNVLVWMSPQTDFSEEMQLIVPEAQEAVRCKDGRVLELFGTGRHTLCAQNAPPHSEVYYINKAHILDIEWSTSNRIPIRDPIYGVILPIGASGQFTVRVEDSRKLLSKLAGALPALSQQELARYFRSLFMAHIQDFISKKITSARLPFLTLHTHLKDVSDAIAPDLQVVLANYGIRLVHFRIASVTIPEDDPAYTLLRDIHAR